MSSKLRICSINLKNEDMYLQLECQNLVSLTLVSYIHIYIGYKAIITMRIKESGHIHREKHNKMRNNLNNSSFRLPHKRSTTTLSEHLWNLKDVAVSYKTEWTILDTARPCSPASKKSDLCLAEKYFIPEPACTKESISYKIRIATMNKTKMARCVPMLGAQMRSVVTKWLNRFISLYISYIYNIYIYIYIYIYITLVIAT